MSTFSLFVQQQGHPGIIEIIVEEGITDRDLHAAIAGAGVALSDDVLVFLDDMDHALDRHRDAPVLNLHHGHRIHVTRCHHITVTVNYLEGTAHREFGPGRRVRAVKAWAAQEFGLDHKDAAEHVLQLCRSADRPTSDTPLHTLVRGPDCSLCFDLVPEKRVEG